MGGIGLSKKYNAKGKNKLIRREWASTAAELIGKCSYCSIGIIVLIFEVLKFGLRLAVGLFC
jgi:hypothetical protein